MTYSDIDDVLTIRTTHAPGQSMSAGLSQKVHGTFQVKSGAFTTKWLPPDELADFPGRSTDRVEARTLAKKIKSQQGTTVKAVTPRQELHTIMERGCTPKKRSAAPCVKNSNPCECFTRAWIPWNTSKSAPCAPSPDR
jgi:hypothetical protein